MFVLFFLPKTLGNKICLVRPQLFGSFSQLTMSVFLSYLLEEKELGINRTLHLPLHVFSGPFFSFVPQHHCYRPLWRPLRSAKCWLSQATESCGGIVLYKSPWILLGISLEVFFQQALSPVNGKSCFSNHALVKAIFEAPKCL